MMPMAEETGQLAGILGDLLTTMERQRSVQSQARRAIMTPAISLVVGFLAAFILFTFVLPRLVDLLGEFGTNLPLTTRFLVGIADFSKTWGIVAVVAFAVAVVTGGAYLSRTTQGRRLWDSFMLRAPVVGPVVRASTMFDVCSMYSLLLQAGVAPVVGLRAVTGTIGNSRIREAFIAVDHEVTQGQRLGLSLLRYSVIPRLFSETVHNGEQAGALQQNLRALADFYQDDTERRVESGTSLIEPLSFLVVGTVIGFIAVAVISGIYSVIPQIGLNA